MLEKLKVVPSEAKDEPEKVEETEVTAVKKKPLSQPKAEAEVTPIKKEPLSQSDSASKEEQHFDAAEQVMKRSRRVSSPVSAGSPMEITLRQSESLKAAQSQILVLEKELQKLRRDNEALVSAAEVLKEKQEQLMGENENLLRGREEDRESFDEEKEVLIGTLDDGRKGQQKLEAYNRELEKRLAQDLDSVRSRELDLQGQIEIMKLEGMALQREKDNKIIEMIDSTRRLKRNLENSNKEKQELYSKLNRFKENARKAVSALRATIHNLEENRFGSQTGTDFDSSDEK